MANAIYPKFKEACLDNSDTDLLTGNVVTSLVDTSVYTYNSAHDFYNDLSGVVGDGPALTGKSITDGLFDAANTTYSAISGNTAEAIVIWINTGNTVTSKLVAYIDTGVTGLPITPNGGDIIIEFVANGIFQL